MIVTTVQNFEKFQKAKKKLGFDDLVSYGNGMVMLVSRRESGRGRGRGREEEREGRGERESEMMLIVGFSSSGNPERERR